MVAVAILAIIAIPILKAFSSSAIMNRNARKEENANAVAGAVAEDFKSLSLERLKEKYNNYKSESEAGTYIFNVTDYGKDYYEGVNGEKFIVEVELNPSAYTDHKNNAGEDTNNPNNNINSFDMPHFSSINETDNIIVRDEIYQWDEDAKGTFCIQSGEADVNKVASQIKRYVDITVSVKLVSEDISGGKFEQTVRGTIRYTYKGCPDYIREFEKQSTFTVEQDGNNQYLLSKKNGLKDVYIFYTAYDIYTNEPVMNLQDKTQTVADARYADDELSVNYEYDENNDSIDYKKLDVYIVQQSLTTKENANDVYISRDNVEIKICGEKIVLSERGTIDLSGDEAIKGPVNIYSNIYGWGLLKTEETGRNNGITINGENGDGAALYTMTVNVWQDKESRENNEEALVTVVSTKEN